MPRKKRAAKVKPQAEDRDTVPEFTLVRFGERRGKYYTSTGTAWPGTQVSLPWEEALVFIERGDAIEAAAEGEA